MALTRIKTDQILDGTITGSDIASGTDIASNNLTLSGDLRGPAIFTIDPAAIGDNTGTVVIAGNLQVDGSTTTINSSTLTVDDKQIVIASGATDNTSADGAGILIDGANATITYDGTNDRFEINKDVQIIGGSISGTDVDVSGATFTVANDQISGDAINGGTATPTTLNSTNLNVDSGTLFVDSANNRVGVGTSSPNEAFHVRFGNAKVQNAAGDLEANNFVLENNTSNQNSLGALTFTNNSVAVYPTVHCAVRGNTANLSNYFLTFHTASSFSGIDPDVERMRIAHNGDISFYEDTGTTPKFFWDASAERLGIGTSSPDEPLSVKADNTSTTAVQIIDRDTNSVASLDWVNTTGSLNCRINNTGQNLRFFTGGEAARIDSSGNVLVGTTTSPSDSGAIVAGGGVYLGGTGSANKLDDYEEGTWTPTAQDQNGNLIGLDSSFTAGTYTKIGRVVVLHGVIAIQDLSGTVSGSDLEIRSLPFTAGNQPTNCFGAVDFEKTPFKTSNTDVEFYSSFISPSGSRIIFVPSRPNNNSPALEIMDLSIDSRISFSITYFTDS